MKQMIFCRGSAVEDFHGKIPITEDTIILKGFSELKQQLAETRDVNIHIGVKTADDNVAKVVRTLEHGEVLHQVYVLDEETAKFYQTITHNVIVCEMASQPSIAETIKNSTTTNGDLKFFADATSVRSKLTDVYIHMSRLTSTPAVKTEKPKKGKVDKKKLKGEIKQNTKKALGNLQNNTGTTGLRNRSAESDALKQRQKLEELQNSTTGKAEEAVAAESIPIVEPEKKAPVPMPEIPLRERASNAAKGVSRVQGFIKSIAAQKSVGQISIINTGNLNLENLATQEYNLDEDAVPVELNLSANRLKLTAYTTPLDYLIANGHLTRDIIVELENVRTTLRVEQHINLDLEDVAIMLNKVSEETVIQAMIEVYNVEFLTSTRLTNMEILTDFYPRGICSKYVFLHLKENPRVLVSHYNNNLSANLGPNFGGAAIMYSLSSCILNRINSEGSWIKDEGGSIFD